MDYNWPKHIEQRILHFADKNKLTGSKRDKFISACYNEYVNAKVPVNEAVGLLAAHSFGEPATQLTLRTKHYAGAAEVSMGSGIERMETLVDARAKTKYPMMTIYIKDEFKNKNMNDFLKELIYKTISDIADVSEDLDERTISIDFKEDVLKKLGLKREAVLEKLKKQLRFKYDETKT